MKDEMTLTTGLAHDDKVRGSADMAAKSVRKALMPIVRYYSRVLGEELSIRQTLLLINAQAAFFMTVFPVDCSLVMRGLCAAWLVSALVKCRRSGIRTSF